MTSASNFLFGQLLTTVFLLHWGLCARSDGSGVDPEEVDIELMHGIVKGYSQYITFLASPSPSKDKSCSARAVVRIDFNGPFNRAHLSLDYDRPRMWTLDVSDSPTGDGYGGDDGTTSNMAETQIFNKQMRIYGNSLPGHLDASIDGGLLLKITDKVVSKKHKRVGLEISDERIEWEIKNKKQFIESKFLYTLSGQNTTVGETDYSVYVGFNRVVGGDFRSGSGLCRAIIKLYADDVDRCKPGSRNQCHKDADCFNTTKSHRCKCKEGYYGNGKICVDLDECEYENGGCVHRCVNTHGSFTCQCKEGFELAPDGRNCIDKDECAVSNGGCDHYCMNTIGSYECRCRPGYDLRANFKACHEGGWCRREYGCSHYCRSTALGVVCVCRDGYRLHSNGKDCNQTCSIGNGGCQHRCTEGATGLVCSCHDKYTLQSDGKTCMATCGVNNGGCDRRCDDTPEGPKCSCPTGFKLDSDGKSCLDIDECEERGAGSTGRLCSHQCVNTHGSFECLCPDGFKVDDDGLTCRDIDECEWNSTCDHICTNTDGSYHCSCREGFDSYGGTHCADRNECSVNNGGCQHNCINSDGSFQCNCHHGYRLHANRRDCTEAVRCSSLKTPAKTALMCSPHDQDQICWLNCDGSSEFITTVNKSFTTRCGPSTNFRWTHEQHNVTLPSCSDQVLAPGYKGKAKFLFFTEQCNPKKRSLDDFERQMKPIVNDAKTAQSCENNDCSGVAFLDLKCNSRKRKFRHLMRRNLQNVMSAEFELIIKPSAPTVKCGVECAREENLQKLKRSLKRLRRTINGNNEKFAVQYEGKKYEVLKKSLRSYKPRDICDTGQVLMDKKCVSCSLGTYFDETLDSCEVCPAGTYQDREGQTSCRTCPHRLSGVGIEGAISSSECGEVCSPGTYSENGMRPCRSCPVGTYQPDHSRTLCMPCGPGITTIRDGATGFQDCLVRETCRSGYYYNKDEMRCVMCPRDTYQPMAGQNFCIDCPGDTQTDTDGANSSVACKQRTCGGLIQGEQGFIQSPNWPGLYPANVECTWKITPEKGRRILVVIPDIYLASKNKCKDFLVLRKSASPYSLTTYETCESSDTPIAFTARSRSLWIYFKTDESDNQRGFSIPYVTYSEEFQELIDDIVRDGRLYSSHRHREVLKDRKLLSALLEVIAQPYNYFKYANVSQTMFPDSFIRLLRNKVMRFFN